MIGIQVTDNTRNYASGKNVYRRNKRVFLLTGQVNAKDPRCLYPGLLLGSTMERAKTFNHFTGIDPDHVPVREKTPDNF